MIWHLVLKPLYNLLWGNRRAERIENDEFWAETERLRRWRDERVR